MNATYNPLLVVLSAVIAVLASYTALELASRVTRSQGLARKLWLMGGATAMGTGIWSMHFIAMLAFSIPIFISYNLGIVLVSLVAAILAAWQALFIVSRPRPSIMALLVGSSLMGLGIAIMHYTGMAAMQMPATVRYKPHLFLLSVIIAVTVSLVALKLSLRFRERTGRQWSKIATACVMGGAVLSMHYTGMGAAIFQPDLTRIVKAAGLDNLSLAYIVCLFTLLVICITLATMYINSEPGGLQS
ncbi:MAG TPA: MHYT domain-containing protein [Waterburya sp.]|jgi:NO-binding membrane sensor protein with MHYT domain